MVELHLHIDTTALFTGTALLAAVAYLLFVQVKSLIPSLVASSMQLVFEKLSHDEEVICAGAVKRLTHIDGRLTKARLPLGTVWVQYYLRACQVISCICNPRFYRHS